MLFGTNEGRVYSYRIDFKNHEAFDRDPKEVLTLQVVAPIYHIDVIVNICRSLSRLDYSDCS
jgi:hypothetical protein